MGVYIVHNDNTLIIFYEKGTYAYVVAKNATTCMLYKGTTCIPSVRSYMVCQEYRKGMEACIIHNDNLLIIFMGWVPTCAVLPKMLPRASYISLNISIYTYMYIFISDDGFGVHGPPSSPPDVVQEFATVHDPPQW